MMAAKTVGGRAGAGSAILVVGLLLAPRPVRGEDWPGWRGPAGTGVSTEKDLPLRWDAKTGEGIAWKASLAGTTGHSSPIVVGDRVIITTAARQGREEEERKEIPDHHVACYRAGGGQLLWRTRVPPGKEPMGYAIYAVPTPCSDGRAVYAWFGSAVIAAVDLDGKLLWRRERAGPFSLNPGICQSPIVCGDTVILSLDAARGQGRLQALDARTGDVRWERVRPSGPCNATPILIDVKGRPQLVAAAENVIEALDPDRGEPIWWCKCLGFGESPVFGGGLVVAGKGLGEGAAGVDPSGSGDVSSTHVRWRIAKSTGDYSSPVIAGDLIFKVRKEGSVGAARVATGEEVFRGDLDGVSKLASPVATADGRIYFVSTGKSHVVKAGPSLQVLGGGDLGGSGNGSSPAVSGGRLFVRDFENLWCIGRK